MVITTLLAILSIACSQSGKQDSILSDLDSVAVVSDFNLEFPEYGFAITAPCQMKDVSAQSSGDFLINYGGTTEENNPKRMAAYQLIVTRVPIGYKDMPRAKYEKLVDEQLRSQMQRFKSYKAIKFGYEEYNGYACETSINGYAQKGVMFAKDNLIIALTVISNDNLETKFNKFTNGFRSLGHQRKDTPIEVEENLSKLDKQYSNSYFSLRYPSSWQVVQDDNQVTANTSIAVQIMEKQKNDVDFRPNINIIVSSKKWKESTSYIAQQSSQNNKQIVPSYKQLGISDTQISGCKGSLLEGTIELQGYKLRSSQYIVKKVDNTTITITVTTDNREHKDQMKIINAILKSIEIK